MSCNSTDEQINCNNYINIQRISFFQHTVQADIFSHPSNRHRMSRCNSFSGIKRWKVSILEVLSPN